MSDERINYPRVDVSPEHTALAKKLGFYVENRGKGGVLYFVRGTWRKASIHEEVMWLKILELTKEVSKLTKEIENQTPNAIQNERNRISNCISRASKELSLHQPTLALVNILVNSDKAEIDIFGSQEIT